MSRLRLKLAVFYALFSVFLALSSFCTGVGAETLKESASSGVHATSGLVMTANEFNTWWQIRHPESVVSAEKHQPEDAFHMVSLSSVDLDAKTASYQLEAGDIINIIILGSPELSREDLTIGTEGVLSLPVIGEIQVRDKTLKTLTAELTAKYGRFVREPNVTLILKKNRPQTVYVMGAIRTPGPYRLEPRDSNTIQPDLRALNGAVMMPGSVQPLLSAALAGAGGLTPDADLQHLKLFNPQTATIREIDALSLLTLADTTQDVVLSGGDVLYIPKLTGGAVNGAETVKLVAASGIGQHQFPVQVYGLVGKPDTYLLAPADMTLQTVLARAGVLPQANIKRIVVARGYKGNAKGLMSRVEIDATSGDTPLQPDDVVIVPHRRASKKAETVFGTVMSIFRPTMPMGN